MESFFLAGTCQSASDRARPGSVLFRDARRSCSLGHRKALVLTLAHLLDGNPVLQFGRNIKLPSRYLFGFLCIGSLNRAETFGAMTNYIDTPASHLS